LIIEDLDLIEKRLNQLLDEKEKQLLSRCQSELEKETLLAEINFSDEEKSFLLNLGFLTMKPVLLVSRENAVHHNELMKNIYQLMDGSAFFTTNEKELHAWQIKKGMTALEAAGCIHSDIQRGFIKAEVIGYEDVIKSGGLNQAKSQGLMRLEDKDYVVKDGDLIKFRFNV
jgi:ribosome-binding ATPase YchF (GTP1/OBG family)